MRTDPITRIVQLHSQLSTEKARLESRLARINKVLDAIRGPATARTAAPAAPAKKRGPGKRRNKLSLLSTMASAMGSRALTKAEIYKAITDAGYKFTGKQPMNSINVQLYTKGQFKRQGKKFSVSPALTKALAA